MDFKSYYSLNKQEKNLLNTNTGSHHHQSLNRMVGSGLNRKHLNFVARKETEKEHLHPKITSCYKNKKDENLTPFEAKDIMDKFGLYPTEDEPKKAIKQLGVYLYKVGPEKYILKYLG
jgi:hypothetical protein